MEIRDLGIRSGGYAALVDGEFVLFPTEDEFIEFCRENGVAI